MAFFDGSTGGNFHNDDTVIDGNLTIGGYTLPQLDGTNNQVLATDGKGNVDWKTEVGIGDVNFNGTAPVVVGEVVLYGATSGLDIKESGILASNLMKLNTTNVMTGSIDLKSLQVNTINSSSPAVGVTTEGVKMVSKKAYFADNSTGSYNFLYMGNNHLGVDYGGILGITSAGSIQIATSNYDHSVSTNQVIVYPDGVVRLDGSLETDTIKEKTSLNGTEINGVSLKDNTIYLSDSTGANNRFLYASNDFGSSDKGMLLNIASDGGLYIDSTDSKGGSSVTQMIIGDDGKVIISDNLLTDTITEKTSLNGTTINGVSLKDSTIYIRDDTGINNRFLYAGNNFNADNKGVLFRIATDGCLYIDSTDASGAGAVQRLKICDDGDVELNSNATLKTDYIATYSTGFTNFSSPILASTIDRSGLALSIGATTASALNLGRTGITTDIQGTTNIKDLYFNTNPILIRAEDNNNLCVSYPGFYTFLCFNRLNNSIDCGAPILCSTIRANGAVPLNLGTTITTAVNIGATGIDTTVNGNFVWAVPHGEGIGGLWSANTVANVPMTNITAVVNINTDYLVNLGTSITTGMASSFTVSTAGRLTYTGTKTRMFHIAYSITSTDTKNASVSYACFKNGVAVQGSTIMTELSALSHSSAIHTMTSLSQNQYIELYTRSSVAANDVTVQYLNIFAMALTS